MKLYLALIGILYCGQQASSISLETDIEEGESYLRGRALKSWPPKGFTIDPTLNCSVTCAPCPIGCAQTYCAPNPIYLPPKSDFWPPVSVIQKPYGPYPKARNATAEYVWWTTEVLGKYPKMIKQSDTKYALSDKEKTLLKMGLTEWMEARAADKYSCMDIAIAMTKRATYLQEVQHMDQFMYWGTFDWVKVVLKQAQKLDRKAAKKGTSAIAPMYCYPVPVKGTVSTIDFPSSVGYAALHTVKSKVDATIATLLKNAHGVQFGKTNVPEMASSIYTGNYANGIAINPWGYDEITGGSSGGSASSVASYIATIAITEDTGGSTNTPATRNHLFGYDPPKFHYPNAGNPSLTVRNDQLGVNARSIDDIIAYDKAILGNSAAHAKAAAYVAGLSNSDIKIGCSDIYYNYTLMSPAITAKYNEAKSVLQAAGFTFVGNCAPLSKNPYTVVLSNYSSSITLDELQYHLTNNLQVNTSVFDVLLNGAFAFSTGLNPTGGRFTGAATSSGCGVWQVNKTVYDEYLDRVPANRSDVYNEYYNQNGVDLVMGPTHYCDYVKWSDDTQVTGSCNGTFFPGGSCMSKCMSVGVNGGRDKVFTKAKFVVPIGQTSTGGVMSLHFMSRAGPRNLAANVSASTWVYDEEGPKTWNLEEIYMVKRIYNVLAAAGMKRADAPMNFISGLF